MTCRHCWRDGAAPIEIVKDGVVEAEGVLCDACLNSAQAELAALRVEFEALLAVGISREQANTIMIAKIDGQGALA